MNVPLKRLRKTAKEPEYGSEGAACFDVFAAEKVDIRANERRIVPLGYAMAVPEDYELVFRPRSGKSLKTGLIIPNSPGTIDSDYRGEVGIIFWNTSDKMITIEIGEKIAQGKVQRVEKTRFTFVEVLSPTKRDEGGYGSTGG